MFEVISNLSVLSKQVSLSSKRFFDQINWKKEKNASEEDIRGQSGITSKKGQLRTILALEQ
jgi:hypothetical protein